MQRDEVVDRLQSLDVTRVHLGDWLDADTDARGAVPK